jgi:hypothetical protein
MYHSLFSFLKTQKFHYFFSPPIEVTPLFLSHIFLYHGRLLVLEQQSEPYFLESHPKISLHLDDCHQVSSLTCIQFSKFSIKKFISSFTNISVVVGWDGMG